MADEMDPRRTCYAYVRNTHEYVCPLQADYDPMEEGRVLWPANTTTVAPPAYVDGKTIPVFQIGTRSWVLTPDYRGQIGYDPDGIPVLIDRAGDPATFTPPLTPKPPSPPEPPVLPPQPVTQVSAAQALIQLSRMPHDGSVIPGTDNLADATEALVAASNDRELKIWFSRSTVWIITDPNVQKIGTAFKLSAEDIQAAFDAASKIGA